MELQIGICGVAYHRAGPGCSRLLLLGDDYHPNPQRDEE